MAELLFDINTLPENIRNELNQLELELNEGDITQKGFEKKKAKLLEPFLNAPKLQLCLSILIKCMVNFCLSKLFHFI